MARRPEAYHERLAEAVVGGGEQETIHAAIRAKQPGLAAEALDYDARGRDSFLDQWNEDGHDHDWAFDLLAGAADPRQVVWAAAEGSAPALRKRYRAAAGAGLEVEYTLSSARPRQGQLTVELNLGLHVPEAADRYVEIDGQRGTPPHFGARACHERVRRCVFVDAWADRALEVAADREAFVTRAPIETISLSEAGAERIFQGLELRYRFDVALEPNAPWRVVFGVVPGAAGAPR